MQKHNFFCSKIWECSTFQPLYLKAPFSPEVVIHSVFNTYFTEYLIQTRICGRHPGDSNPQKRTSPSSSEAYCLKRKKINTQHQVMMNALRDWNPRGSIIVWILTVLQRCICCWRDCLETGPTEGIWATEGVILKGILALQGLFILLAHYGMKSLHHILLTVMHCINTTNTWSTRTVEPWAWTSRVLIFCCPPKIPVKITEI